MKLSSNKYILTSFLLISFISFADQVPPIPQPASTPPPPGFAIDSYLYLLVVFGIVLVFKFLKNNASINKKEN